MNIIPYVNRPAPLAWDVAKAIFGATGSGAWYDPSDLSTVFQDAAGTTPSGVGDPVRLVVDSSGNGEDLLAANDAQRVTLTQVGGHYGLAFDYADDALSNTFANTLTGELFIAGRKGSIFASFSGSTLTIGPTSYTGGLSGILRAIGDVVGIVLLDRALTEDEQTKLVEYYKGKGAKGLLVEGPELVVNGDFSDGTTGWTPNANVTQSVVDGRLKLEATSGTSNFQSTQSLSGSSGKVYIGSATIESASGNSGLRARVRFTDGLSELVPSAAGEAQERKRVFVSVVTPTATPAVASTAAWGSVGDIAYFDNISLKELRAEEDWT